MLLVYKEDRIVKKELCSSFLFSLSNVETSQTEVTVSPPEPKTQNLAAEVTTITRETEKKKFGCC
jgi:hypothetical protein